MISWGCEQPSLSDATHPFFSRTVTPLHDKGPALIAFLRHNNWRRLGVLSSSDNVYFEGAVQLQQQFEAAGIEVLRPAAFLSGNFDESALIEIRKGTICICLVLCYDEDSQTVASTAQQEGMMTAGWAWLLTNEKTAVEAMTGWLWLRPFIALDMHAFAQQAGSYSSQFNSSWGAGSLSVGYSAALYNAIMLYAQAATKLLCDRGDLRDGKAVTRAMRNSTFMGVEGTFVALNGKGDRSNESFEVMNLVHTAPEMKSAAVGLYNSTEWKYLQYGLPVVWPGGTVNTPRDAPLVEEVARPWLVVVSVAIYVLSSFGMFQLGYKNSTETLTFGLNINFCSIASP